jgi:hypothetical protein
VQAQRHFRQTEHRHSAGLKSFAVKLPGLFATRTRRSGLLARRGMLRT